MDPKTLRDLLEAVEKGQVSPDQALEQLRTLPYEDLGFAKVDHHRALRRGFPEVVFGASKTPAQIARIVMAIAGHGQSALVTRATPEAFEEVPRTQPQARYDAVARCIVLQTTASAPLPGRVALVCAGTSDLPVAEEAAVTLEFLGGTVDKIYDAGVAGLHRL